MSSNSNSRSFGITGENQLSSILGLFHWGPVSTGKVKELAGFAKLELAPGASETARVELSDRSFARWDPAVHDWVVDPGSYSIVLAVSATDVRATVDVTL